MQINKISIMQKTNTPLRSTSPIREVAPKGVNTDNVEVLNKNQKRKKAILSALGIVALATGLYFIFKDKPADDSNPPSGGNTEPSEPNSSNQDNSIKDTKIKLQSQEYSDLWAQLRKCNNDIDNLSNEGKEKNELLDLRKSIVQKIEDLEQRAITENFSLLEKKDLSNASEDKRWKYFDDYAFRLMRHNEASAFDCIEMFEKYGMRKKIDPNKAIGGSTMEKFMRSIPNKPSDALSSRLFDALDKLITPDLPNFADEVNTVSYILFDRDFNMKEKISEDTLLKAINLFKKMEFWNSNVKDLFENLDFYYIQRKFKDSPRLPEIKNAVNELQTLWNKHHNIIKKI